jgi:WD40 repeat protein
LYSGSYDRTVRGWDIEKGECIAIYNDNDNWVTTVAVSEPYLYCGGYDCVINVYDVKARRKVQILEGHVKRIEDIIIDETGKVYSSSADQTVRVWDVDVRFYFLKLNVNSLENACTCSTVVIIALTWK